jgi:hypothetical protein
MYSIVLTHIRCERMTSWTYDDIRLVFNSTSLQRLDCGTFTTGQAKTYLTKVEIATLPVRIDMLDLDVCSEDDQIGSILIWDSLESITNSTPKEYRFEGSGAAYIVTLSITADRFAKEAWKQKQLDAALSISNKGSREYWQKNPAEWGSTCLGIRDNLVRLAKTDPSFNVKFVRNVKSKEIHLEGCRYTPKESRRQYMDVNEAYQFAINQDHDFCAYCLRGLDRR